MDNTAPTPDSYYVLDNDVVMCVWFCRGCNGWQLECTDQQLVEDDGDLDHVLFEHAVECWPDNPPSFLNDTTVERQLTSWAQQCGYEVPGDDGLVATG